MKAKNVFVLVFFILVSQIAGAIGSIFTFNAIPTWYAGLQKPAFNPPNWLFGPVWIILYLLMGISAYLVWSKGRKNKSNKENAKHALMIFFVQLVLNALWSIIFFGFNMTGIACFEIILLWLFILLMIIRFYPVSRTASLLQIPYLLWVSFASVLNMSIWFLNKM